MSTQLSSRVVASRHYLSESCHRRSGRASGSVALGARALSSAELLAHPARQRVAAASRRCESGTTILAGAGGSLRRLATQPVAALTAIAGRRNGPCGRDPRRARARPADGGGGARGRRAGPVAARRATRCSRRGSRICRSRSSTSRCSTRSTGSSATSRSRAGSSTRRSCIRARCSGRRSPSGRRRSSSCTIIRAAIRRRRRTTGS